MQAIVCHEVETPGWVARCIGRWEETDRLTSSFNSAIASPSDRIFGIKVSDLPLVTALYRPGSLSGRGVSFAYLIEFSFSRSLLVLGYKIANPTVAKLDGLRRPELKAQKEIFNAFNVAAIEDSTVYSTMVSEGPLADLEKGRASDGWLHLELRENKPEVAFEYIRELCSWVAMERALISSSIAELVRKPTRFEMSTSRLSRVKAWLRDSITNPPVDKSIFIKYMNDLRASLNLVALREELGDRSDRAIQGRNITVAGFGLALTAVFSILAFALPPVFEWFK